MGDAMMFQLVNHIHLVTHHNESIGVKVYVVKFVILLHLKYPAAMFSAFNAMHDYCIRVV